MMARRLVMGLALFGLAFGLAGAAQATTDLHLLGDRFLLSAKWQTPDGASGTAQAVSLTGETGYFWFFSPGNVELMVKVLDACSPFDRFWFFASGMTNVEVELTVEDTWTGESKTYSRPGGSMFAPLADTSSFGGCGAPKPCGQGTREQIEATPRPNTDAEVLALLLGTRITADPGIYARLDADLARIRAFRPSLANIHLLQPWDASSLMVELTPAAFAAMRAGQYKEWDCLNDWYRLETSDIVSNPWVDLYFEGLFHPARIGLDYATLPGVVRTEPSWFGYTTLPGGNICAAIDGAAYDYFVQDTGFRTWYFRVPHALATPVEVGSVGSGEPKPDWWTRYEQCTANLSKAAAQ